MRSGGAPTPSCSPHVVLDPAGRYDRGQHLAAGREREMFERQLRALGCSGEALRRLERDAEIEEFGAPRL